MGRPNSHIPGSPAFLPVLLVLFVGSGCAALIYEIVWFQLLQLVIGSSAVSLGVLLGTFMGGMCLGSLLLPRLVPATRHPLRVYAVLELGIGAIGVVALFGMPAVDQVYTANAGHGIAGIALRAVVCAACLLPPTLLMGATLPAVARWVEATPRGVSWLGLFYGGNIAGAVFGCLLAGFYLLPNHDMELATYTAAAINVGVAALAFGMAAITGTRHEPRDARHEREKTVAVVSRDSRLVSASTWPVYVAIALSGMSALGAEVIWTRLLSLTLGATVYTFSIILAVFLVGLGIGSTVGSALSRGEVSPRHLLCGCQALLAAAIGWAAFALARSLPYWPIDPALSPDPLYNFQLDLVRCAWAVLPAAILWGASFPLALAAAAQGQDPGRLVGGVYAANTLGAIVGAVGFSVLLIGWVGTQHAQQVLIGLCATAAVLAAVPSKAREPGATTAGPTLGATGAFAMSGIVGIAALIAWGVPAVPWGLVAYGRSLPKRFDDIANESIKSLYVGEGMNSSVAVSEETGGMRNFHVSGKVEASSEPQDMRLQRMLGHLPALLHPKPKSVLIVGCGAGVTAGSFVLHPSIERIVICELEPLVPHVVATYFGKENYHIVDGIDKQNPHTVNGKQVEVIFDDARHYVLTTRESFDIITSDPIHPWVKGAATLYTKEYFELVKKRLNPGGVVTQWVPLYESNSAVVKSEVATFFAAFPGGTIWGNDINGKGYDVVLFGRTDETPIDVRELQVRLDQPDHTSVAKSLREVSLGSAVEMLGTYAGRASDLKPWTKDAEINHDRNLRLQYLAGKGVNYNLGERIYDDMLAYRGFPEDLFVGHEQFRLALRRLIDRPPDR
jgi:spermidine synthase